MILLYWLVNTIILITRRIACWSSAWLTLTLILTISIFLLFLVFMHNSGLYYSYQCFFLLWTTNLPLFSSYICTQPSHSLKLGGWTAPFHQFFTWLLTCQCIFFLFLRLSLNYLYNLHRIGGSLIAIYNPVGLFVDLASHLTSMGQIYIAIFMR